MSDGLCYLSLVYSNGVQVLERYKEYADLLLVMNQAIANWEGNEVSLEYRGLPRKVRHYLVMVYMWPVDPTILHARSESYWWLSDAIGVEYEAAFYRLAIGADMISSFRMRS